MSGAGEAGPAGGRGASISGRVRRYLAERRPMHIDRPTLEELRRYVREEVDRPVSDRRLLELLLETDVEIDRALGGIPPDLRGKIRTSDPQLAAAALIEMAGEYERAREGGERERARDCRKAVLLGKDRLKRSLARKNLSVAKREEKQELLAWFLVWLESPGIFSDWLALRLRTEGE